MKVFAVVLILLPIYLSALDTPDLKRIRDLLKSSKRTDFKSLLRKLGLGFGSKKTFACPVPGTFFETERTEPTCTEDKQCRKGELCCQWFQTKHCLKGIDTTLRHGICPKITFLNDMCIADYAGCRYDEECHGEDEKCCQNSNCHYKECLSIRQNIACPMPKSTEPSDRKEPRCNKDVQCEENEKCCDWFGNKYCLKGINIIPKQGFCPMDTPASHMPCKGPDFPSCFHDAECPGAQEKCCRVHECEPNYHECIDMNAEFTCPTINHDQFSAQKGKSCEKNADCDGFSSICCNLNGDKHCIAGIHISPKQGECPAVSTLRMPCIAGHPGECEYDSQCNGGEKCCDTNCNYKQCITEPIDPVPILEEGSSTDNQQTKVLDEIMRELGQKK